MEVISRQEATEQGFSRYYTGEPCNRGEIAERAVADKKCLCAAHRQARAENARARYLRDRESRIAKQKRHYRENGERRRAYGREHYRRNQTVYIRKAVEWAARNPSKARENSRRAAAGNPVRLRHQVNERRAAKMNATPPWYGEFDGFVIRQAHELAHARTTVTGFRWEADHTLPLRGTEVCGLHVGRNIQVIPMAENRRKSNRLQQEGM